MAAQEKKFYYMAVARDKVIIADFAKAEVSRNKANFQLFTNDILPKASRGTYCLPYKE